LQNTLNISINKENIINKYFLEYLQKYIFLMFEVPRLEAPVGPASPGPVAFCHPRYPIVTQLHNSFIQFASMVPVISALSGVNGHFVGWVAGT
jgi:hypothetical protein